MSWRGRLHLHYTLDSDARGAPRTTAVDRHEGPLRVLRRLYPEGPAICHHVLVHPPGGIAGGDVLEIDAQLDPGTHALLTTPGATRFYRSDGAPAAQHVQLTLSAGARAEWLPLESIAYDGCLAENRVQLQLDETAELIGWDVLALGLPAAGQPFRSGHVLQHLELAGQWLERGLVEAGDLALLDAPPGWAGQRVCATLWFARGAAWSAPRRETLLDAARRVIAASPLARTAGATAPNEHVVVLRALADRVEPVMELLSQVRAEWRLAAWSLPPATPRIWRT